MNWIRVARNEQLHHINAILQMRWANSTNAHVVLQKHEQNTANHRKNKNPLPRITHMHRTFFFLSFQIFLILSSAAAAVDRRSVHIRAEKTHNIWFNCGHAGKE